MCDWKPVPRRAVFQAMVKVLRSCAQDWTLACVTRIETCPAVGLDRPPHGVLAAAQLPKAGVPCASSLSFPVLASPKAQHQHLREDGGPRLPLDCEGVSKPQRSASQAIGSSLQCLLRSAFSHPVLHRHRAAQEPWVGDTVTFSRDDAGETEYIESLRREEGGDTPIFQAIIIEKPKCAEHISSS